MKTAIITALLAILLATASVVTADESETLAGWAFRRRLAQRMWARAFVLYRSEDTCRLRLLFEAIELAQPGNSSEVADALIYICNDGLIDSNSLDDESFKKDCEHVLTRIGGSFANSDLEALSTERGDLWCAIVLSIYSESSGPERGLIELAAQSGSGDAVACALAASLVSDNGVALQCLSAVTSNDLRHRAIDLLLESEPNNGANDLLLAWAFADENHLDDCISALRSGIAKEEWVVYDNPYPVAPGLKIPTCYLIRGDEDPLVGKPMEERFMQVLANRQNYAFGVLHGVSDDLEDFLHSPAAKEQSAELAALMYVAGLRLMASRQGRWSHTIIGNHLCARSHELAVKHFALKGRDVERVDMWRLRFHEAAKRLSIVSGGGMEPAAGGALPFDAEREGLQRLREVTGFRNSMIDDFIDCLITDPN